MALQSARAATLGVTLLGIVFAVARIAAVTGDDVRPPVGTMLCSPQVYSATDSFAADIDRVLDKLPILDSDVLPTIDVNVYSPEQKHPVAYGRRTCEMAIGILCEDCFRDACNSLVSACRNNYKAGGQITMERCFVRYEIYNFITP